MKRLLAVVVCLALLVGVATVWGAYSRDITGDLRRDAATLNQAILKALEYMISDGIPVVETSTAIVAVTKNTWTALSTIDTAVQRRLLISTRTVTANNTATVTVWGSDDGGTTYFPMLLSTGAKARAVAIAVGTAAIGGGNYADAFEIMVGPATHIYVQETAVGTDNLVYETGGL